MRIGSLFSGIGGLELGLEWSGIGHTVWQVERDEFCRRVLERHWPNVARFDDVYTAGAATLVPVDLICGGFPCQDVSGAGKGEGLTGSRSGLWFEYLRIVGELKPEWVVVENVASGATRWVDAVRQGLEQLGYEAIPFPLSAFDVGAPHERARVFIVAHANSVQLREQSGRRGREDWQEALESQRDGGTGVIANTASIGRPALNDDAGSSGILPETSGQWSSDSLRASVCSWSAWPPFSPVCGMDARFPNRIQRLRALGNAVVPACAEVIGYIIKELGGAQ